MFASHPVHPLFGEMPQKSVNCELHRRGEGPFAPTKGTHQRHHGLLNKGTFRHSYNVFPVLLILFSSLAFAHEGFSTVLKDVSVGAYTVTVLEDTHIAEGQGQMNLMIQVANGRDAAPADTNVWLRLEHDDTFVYDGEVNYVGSSSSDGRSFYAYYLVTIPMIEMGTYQAQLNLDGSLGRAETQFEFEAKATPELRAVELIPSLLILSIGLAGLLLFFASTKPLTQKGLRHA